ncbi:MAG: NADH-quinone oxidoreductase subunit NuoE [Planctomycetes bacterium]|nr:NADH-quinone oxidoreductase subunit NuoE [Planctomycetota bacterium]
MEDTLNDIFSEFEGKEEELIPLLQGVQSRLGYLPEEGLKGIARFLGIPESRVYAVATFYAQFRFTPIGKKHVLMCRGTACHVQGAPRILAEMERRLGIKEGETTEDMEYSLESVACVGACGLAPIITVNQKTYGRMTVKKVEEIVSDTKLKKEGVLG